MAPLSPLDYAPKAFIQRQLERDREEWEFEQNPMAAVGRTRLPEIARVFLSLSVEDHLQLKQELQQLCPTNRKAFDLILLWALKKTHPSISPDDFLADLEHAMSASPTSNGSPEANEPPPLES